MSAGSKHSALAAILRRPVAHPRLYVCFIALSTLDLVLTVVILSLGGSELNAIAAGAVRAAGVWGLMLVKFASVGVVLTVCESLAALPDGGARRLPAMSRRIAEWAVAISTIPVAVALVQIWYAAAAGRLPL